MDYSPKLRNAMEEIKAILIKYDAAGSIIINAPDRGSHFTEFLTHVSPSWSCVFLEGPRMRLRARLEEDYQGDKEKRNQAIQDSVNMLDHFWHILTDAADNFNEMIAMIESKITLDRSDPGKITFKGTEDN